MNRSPNNNTRGMENRKANGRSEPNRYPPAPTRSLILNPEKLHPASRIKTQEGFTLHRLQSLVVGGMIPSIYCSPLDLIHGVSGRSSGEAKREEKGDARLSSFRRSAKQFSLLVHASLTSMDCPHHHLSPSLTWKRGFGSTKQEQQRATLSRRLDFVLLAGIKFT